MISSLLVFMILSLLHAASPRILTPLRAPALTSDFKKNNVSASWAPGHPREWNDKDANYELSSGGITGNTPGGIVGAVLTDADKFLITVTFGHLVTVKEFSTNVTLSTLIFGAGPNYSSNGLQVILALGGGFDVLVTTRKKDENLPGAPYQIHRLQFSSNGTQIPNNDVYAGGFVDGTPRRVSGKQTRRFLAHAYGEAHYAVYVYDLDDNTFNLTISGHTDFVESASFSPHEKYITTASWDGYAKLWNATSGELIRSFGPSGTINTLIRWSPDGTQFVVSLERRGVQIWSLGNLTTNYTALGPIEQPIQSMAWSSDGEYIAIGASGSITVWKMQSVPRLVQNWSMVDTYWPTTELVWLEGTKLSYRGFGGLDIYDFKKNLKYRWCAGEWDHWGNYGSTWVVVDKRWIGGVDADRNIRFYQVPE